MRLLSSSLVCAGLLALAACEDDTVTSPELTATCEARPASGAAPLTVSFVVNVSGAEGTPRYTIAYGDGQSGTNPDTPHTYGAAGSYTAAFDVATSTQSARCSTVVNVSGSAPPAGGNQPPNAVFRTTPAAVGSKITGTAPLTVSFNMCATSDPENDEIYFLMDFDGDERFDFGGITGFHCRADRVYAAGTWTAVLCLYDRKPDKTALHDDICAEYEIVAQ
jgi:hypothetical protein